MFKITLNILIIWGLYSLFTSPQFTYVAKFLKVIFNVLVSAVS